MAMTVSLTLPATNKYDEAGNLVDIPEVTYPQAYARLFSVRAFSADSYLLVCWYADEAARFADEPPVKMWEFLVPTATLKGDVYPAAYEYLKTLPEFEGAIDHPVADPGDIVTPVEPVPEPTQPPASA